MALQDKLLNEEKRDQYKDLYEQVGHDSCRIGARIGKLRADYDEVLAKRQYYAARMESLRSDSG